MNQIRVAVIGDEANGKTQLINALMNNSFSKEYVPTITDEHTLVHDNKAIVFLDTPGNEDYAQLRTACYSGIQVFLLVFSIDHKKAVERLPHWVAEEGEEEDEEKRGLDLSIRLVSSAPFILVGTKSDLRKNQPEKVIISHEEADKLAKKIGALGYVEVSAIDKTNVPQLLSKIIQDSSSLSNAKAVSSEGLPFKEGTLKVKAIRGNNLRIGDSNGFSDPFFLFGTWSKNCQFRALAKSKTKHKTLNPVWDELLEINLSARKIKGTEGIAIQIWDEDLIGKDFLGVVNYKWDVLPQMLGKTQTVELHEEENKKEVGVKGTVTFEINFSEHEAPQKMKSTANLHHKN